ncbi:MAG: hypothetical protein JWO09_2614 [Bacteroidetes bacterium]|nr:hypothetical protein [Bacteroidota bacterium]
MKLKNIFFTAGILFAAGRVAAQVPGYMGKRLVIGYSNYLSPALISPSANGPSPGLNTTHCFNLEYVIKNRLMLCAGYQMLNTGAERTQGYGYTVPGNYGYAEIASYRPDNGLPMQVKDRNFSVGFKLFGTGLFAPVGGYQKLELILMSTNLSYEKKGFYPQGDPVHRLTLGTGSYDYKNIAIALTLGKERVFFGRLSVDAGIRFGIMPGVILGTMGSVLFDDGTYTYYESQMQRNLNFRLQGAQLVNFHIGIGLLAL